MGAEGRSLDRVLEQVERRLERIEALLQLSPLEAALPGAGFPSDPEKPVKTLGAHDSAGPAAVPFAGTGVNESDRSVAPTPNKVSIRELLTPAPLPITPPPLPVIPAYAPRRVAAKAAPDGALEQTIGLKWAGWVGAVVVVIGVALGIKFAYDQRWFEILPPAGRLAMMSLAAFALIGAGEVVYRRVHRFAAACLFGAGVATLFLVSYAGFGYYRLYEQQTAFVLMALSTVLGAAVAIRGDFVSIAVLAQIGGNLAPVLLRSDHPRLVPFLFYLLTLQAVALVLAWRGASAKWLTLRGISLATTGLWLVPLIGSHRFAADTGTLLAYCLTYAAAFQAELILSAGRRAVGHLGPVQRVAFDDPVPAPHAKGGPGFSLLVTALLTVALLAILRDASDAARGVWVLALSTVCAAGGLALTRRGTRGGALTDLGTGFRIQAGALAVVAVPVALSGIWVIVGWAVLALAFAALGHVLHVRLARRSGVVVWCLAVLYLGWWTVDALDSVHSHAAHAIWFHLLGADVRAFTVVAWILACVGHAVARLVRPHGPAPAPEAEPKFQGLAAVTQGLADLAWVAASVAGLPPAGATLAILVYAWLLLAADLLRPRPGLALQSGAAVALAMVKWMAVDTLADRLSPGWSAAARTPVFNAVMGDGLLLSLTMVALYWLRRDVLWAVLTRYSNVRYGPDGRPAFSAAAPAIALAAALAAVLAIGLSFEIDRVVEAAAPGLIVWPRSQTKQMAWTVLWTIILCGFLGLSRRLEPDDRLRPVWVRAADNLVLAVAVKFLLIDTLLFRLAHGPAAATPLVNFQSFTALIVVAGLIAASYLMTRRADGADGAAPGTGDARSVFALAGFLAVLVVLWGGTLEIDRWFEQLAAAGSALFRDPGRAKQVAFSIFWSVFAVSSVVAGFRFRTAGLRYFGLGLFAVTVLKVVLVDMSQVQTGYRVLSFLGLGLLLMGTSVLYGKLSPVLLRDRQPTTL